MEESKNDKAIGGTIQELEELAASRPDLDFFFADGKLWIVPRNEVVVFPDLGIPSLEFLPVANGGAVGKRLAVPSLAAPPSIPEENEDDEWEEREPDDLEEEISGKSSSEVKAEITRVMAGGFQ